MTGNILQFRQGKNFWLLFLDKKLQKWFYAWMTLQLLHNLTFPALLLREIWTNLSIKMRFSAECFTYTVINYYCHSNTKILQFLIVVCNWNRLKEDATKDNGEPIEKMLRANIKLSKHLTSFAYFGFKLFLFQNSNFMIPPLNWSSCLSTMFSA